MAGAMRGFPRDKRYQELGLESLQLPRWWRNLLLFYNVLKNENPQCLFKLIPMRHSLCTTRNVSNLPLLT